MKDFYAIYDGPDSCISKRPYCTFDGPTTKRRAHKLLLKYLDGRIKDFQSITTRYRKLRVKLKRKL